MFRKFEYSEEAMRYKMKNRHFKFCTISWSAVM